MSKFKDSGADDDMRPRIDPAKEYPDPTPVSIPLGLEQPESLQDSMRRMIRNEMSMHAASNGMETFDEALDFDLDDSEDNLTNAEKADLMADDLLEDFNVTRRELNEGVDIPDKPAIIPIPPTPKVDSDVKATGTN